jgi:hypothetical protein
LTDDIVTEQFFCHNFSLNITNSGYFIFLLLIHCLAEAKNGLSGTGSTNTGGKTALVAHQVQHPIIIQGAASTIRTAIAWLQG